MEKNYLVSFTTGTPSSMGVEMFEKALEAAVRVYGSGHKSYRASFHELPAKKGALAAMLKKEGIIPIDLTHANMEDRWREIFQAELDARATRKPKSPASRYQIAQRRSS